MFRLRLLLFLAVPLLLASDCAAFADDLFEQQVAPLLERRCLSCHNSVDRRGNFSLQSAETLLQSGHVVAGQPDDSQLLTVVTSQNGKPPEMPGSGPPLTDAEVLLLRRWIQQGAAWPAARQLQEPVVSDFGWWSFQPLNKPPVPAFSDTAAAA
ncbi:MAG: c-type cytochrome domain-containing protein, partial [Planctomycetaceae bacterium]